MNSSIATRKFQAREVRAHATVDAQPEGGVSIGGAVDDELVGVVEGLRDPDWPPGKPRRTQSSFFIGQPKNS